MKNMKKAFALHQEDKQESDISRSDGSDDSDGSASHFQFHGHDHFKFAQKAVTLYEQPLDPRIERLFKQSHGTRPHLDLREVVLLDSQSTIDLVCNKELVTDISKSNKNMQLKSNGGVMTINQPARMKGYANLVWFSKDAIANILALSNVIKQYRVTHDSDDKTFIVHRQSIGLPDMEFRMHHSELHYFDPREKEFTFIKQDLREQRRLHQTTDQRG
jgi:hypothetical protein